MSVFSLRPITLALCRLLSGVGDDMVGLQYSRRDR